MFPVKVGGHNKGVPQGSALGWEELRVLAAVLCGITKCTLIKLPEVMLGGIAAFWEREAEL